MQTINNGETGASVRAKINANFTETTNSLATKQDTLVSGTNIKRINGNDLTGAGDITVTATGTIGGFRDLATYFTSTEWTAIQTDNYSSVSVTDITTKFEDALAAAEGKWRLTWEGPAYIKVNRPVRYYGRLNLGPMASSMYGFMSIYPDLSVNWRSTYPLRGVLESANFQYPTLPPGKGSWPNSKPDFIAATTIENVTIDADRDSLYSANKNRVPDFGHVVHCANEAFVMRNCYGNRCGIAGILVSGLQSTPTFYNCGGFNNGRDTDTRFGATVTRTTGGAFAADVYVWAGTNAVAGPSIILEAAGSTDLSSIAGGNVLTINGVGYTVSSASTTTSITERTIIGGTVTTTRSIRTVTFTGNIPAYTAGRHSACGIAYTTHPNGASFASGVSAADGGQGDGGMVITHNFSGDYNGAAMMRRDGRFILNAFSTKSENNPSLLLSRGNGENGGDDGTALFVGYRCPRSSMTDQGIFRLVGQLYRPSLLAWGKQDGTGAYVDIVQNLTDSTMPGVTNHGNGRGPVFWNGDSNRISYWNGVELWDRNIKANLFVPITKPTITGSRSGNAALDSLLSALSGLGLITNSTTA